MRPLLGVLAALAVLGGVNYAVVAVLAPGMGGILLFVEALIVMILLHEAGHFFFAKAFGIKVEEFFVGFGPRLWSTRRGETEYGVKALVLGGYVRIAGMNPFQEVPPEDRPRTFGVKPAWQRALVLVAGSASHFLLAVVFLAVVFAFVGVPLGAPPIDEVERRLDGQRSPAAAAGLRPGDRVVAADGRPMDSNQELIAYTRENVGEEIRLTVERDGRRFPVEVRPVPADVGGERVGRIGVVLGLNTTGPVTAVWRGAAATGDMTVRAFQALGQVFSPSGLARIGELVVGSEERDVSDPAGIVGAARLSGQAASSGNFGILLGFLAGLNVFVGILNILPLPPLDGGHLAVLGWEVATGRKVDMRKLIPVTAAVAGVLILLTISLLYLDLVSPIPDPFQ